MVIIDTWWLWCRYQIHISVSRPGARGKSSVGEATTNFGGAQLKKLPNATKVTQNRVKHVKFITSIFFGGGRVGWGKSSNLGGSPPNAGSFSVTALGICRFSYVTVIRITLGAYMHGRDLKRRRKTMTDHT